MANSNTEKEGWIGAIGIKLFNNITILIKGKAMVKLNMKKYNIEWMNKIKWLYYK